MFFKDPIPSNTTFVGGSVKINGISQLTYDPETGFALNNLSVGENVIVEFKVLVN